MVCNDTIFSIHILQFYNHFIFLCSKNCIIGIPKSVTDNVILDNQNKLPLQSHTTSIKSHYNDNDNSNNLHQPKYANINKFGSNKLHNLVLSEMSSETVSTSSSIVFLF